MNPFEYMQALTELWSRGGKDFAAAQHGTSFDIASRLATATGQEGAPGSAPVTFFDLQGMTKANEAFAKLWSSAIELSQTVTRNAQEGKKQDPLVTDLLGKSVANVELSAMAGQNDAVIETTGWAAGSYLIKLHVGNEVLGRKVIVTDR